MLLFKIFPLFDEFTEGSDGSTEFETPASSEAPSESSESSPSPSPSPFIGDFDEQGVLDLLGYTKELPDRLSSMEGRFSESLSPLQQRLEEVQKALGSRVAFQPKLEKFKEKLAAYDPALGEAADVLISELTESLQVNPLDKTSLEPHISPYLDELRSGLESQYTDAMLGFLPFSADEIVARNAQGEIQDPQTALQKDFYSWWGLQDSQTQQALRTYGLPYVSALQRFSKWREGRIKEKGAAAGALSTRLASGQAPSSTTQRQPGRNSQRTEQQEFEAGFNAVLEEMTQAR